MALPHVVKGACSRFIARGAAWPCHDVGEGPELGSGCVAIESEVRSSALDWAERESGALASIGPMTAWRDTLVETKQRSSMEREEGNGAGHPRPDSCSPHWADGREMERFE